MFGLLSMQLIKYKLTIYLSFTENIRIMVLALNKVRCREGTYSGRLIEKERGMRSIKIIRDPLPSRDTHQKWDLFIC